MKKLLYTSIFVSILLCAAIHVYALSPAIQAVVSAASIQTDLCTNSLTFSWHAESTTVTEGGIAGGVNNGCSAGDTTASASGSPTIETTDNKSDGIKAAYFNVPNEKFSFTAANIVGVDQGTIDFHIYPTTLGNASIFRYSDGANNYIFVTIAGGTEIEVNYRAGGTLTYCRTSGANVVVNTLQRVVAKYRQTGTPNIYVSVNGVTCTSNVDASTWNASVDGFTLGENNGSALVFFLDNIQIYSAYMSTGSGLRSDLP